MVLSCLLLSSVAFSQQSPETIAYSLALAGNDSSRTDTIRTGDASVFGDISDYRDELVAQPIPDSVDIIIETPDTEPAAQADTSSQQRTGVLGFLHRARLKVFGPPPTPRTVPDSVKGTFYASVSIRNPNIATYTDAQGEVRNSPFEYEVATGFAGTYGDMRFSMDVQREREARADGIKMFLNHDWSFSRTVQAYSFGARLSQHEENDFYLLSGYIEARLFGWVGMGVTRTYHAEWLENGENYARFTLAKNSHTIFGINLYIRAEFDVNPSKGTDRELLYIDIRNVKYGRVGLVPYYQYERVKAVNTAYATDPTQPEHTVTSRYQGKIKLTVDI